MDLDDDTPATTAPTSVDPTTTDLTTQLFTRYSKSPSPQHHHLLATSAALKSLITSSSLPLSPLSYFAAAISSLSSTPSSSPQSSSALSTLLSLTLPLIPPGAISPAKAREAVGVLVKVLEEERDGECNGTARDRCVVKCLGVLLVGFCDFDDWVGCVELPVVTLLKFSLDKRPKVRKCAVEYLESAFKSLQTSTSKKDAGKLILSLLQKSISVLEKTGSVKTLDGAENSDVVHALGVTRVTLPYLCDKTSVKIVKKLVKLLSARFSALSRLIVNCIEVFFEKADVEVIALESEDIICALSSYLSSKDNLKDSVIPAAKLLKCALDKIHASDQNKWNESFPRGVKAIAGLLTCEDDVASEASNLLKDVIDHQLSGVESQPVSDEVPNGTEVNAVASLCSVFMDLLECCAGIPNEHIVAVVSALFLKLGSSSYLYTRNIVLKLANILDSADCDESKTCHLQKCFGCAVVAMGPENVLSLVPISFSKEKLTCSNKWLLPILKEYIYGASLGYFMEHIVPIAESIQRASRKVKKSVTGQELQAHANGVWSLLPSFCRYPTDISQNFQPLAKLIIARLEKDASVHEDIAVALQELVKQNKCISKVDEAPEPVNSESDLLENCLSVKRKSCSYSKKQSVKNIKAMSSCSHELLRALVYVLLDTPHDKRSSLKKAVSCLASISDSSVTKNIFISVLKRFTLVTSLTESGEFDDLSASFDDTPSDASSLIDDSQWHSVLVVASSFVEGADEDLVDLIFRLAKYALQVGEEMNEAFSTLVCILEEHPWFCSSKLDELVELLFCLKSPGDMTSLAGCLNCFRILLVYTLKSSSDVESKMPFLILNEIILALKDSKEEARKLAYDVLLSISSSLGESSAADPDGPYYRLISTILGYISGSSPHTISAAVSALSVFVYKEPELCLAVPDLVPSVTSLLQTKAVEVVKAALGFIKVLVSCLETKDLQNFVSPIVDGVIGWSSVSRHHFRSKVTIILEIIIRKCGLPALQSVTPERYKSFIKKVSQNRHGKTAPNERDSADANSQHSNASENRHKKRLRNDRPEESGSVFHVKKRRNDKQDSHSSGAARTDGAQFNKKRNRSEERNSTTREAPRKSNVEKFRQAGKHNKRNPSKGEAPRKFKTQNNGQARQHKKEVKRRTGKKDR